MALMGRKAGRNGRPWLGRIVGVLLTAAVAFGATSDYERALAHYQKTEYRAALDLLLPLAEKDARVWALIGKAAFMSRDYKRASQAFEKAVAASPRNSEYHLWLGRAYGRRAETSSFLTAPGLATKARDSFEKAVALNPRSIEALNDLFEYYLEAPGFLGGGHSKAAALVEKIGEIDPAERHYAAARLAEKRKEFGTAEEQLRQAARLAPRQIGRVIDLAKFFAKQRRYDESDEEFRRAEQIAPRDPKLLFERAATYVRTGRNLAEAKRLLQEYINSPLTPDHPPRAEAERLLKQLS